jgi:Icc-related predicted phosphoesterase
MSCILSILLAANHADWDAYQKANRFTCPGPLDTMTTDRQIRIEGKLYKQDGYKLTVQDGDADSVVRIGIISAIKDIAEETLLNIEHSLRWFREQKIEWLVVNGDIAIREETVGQVVAQLAATKLPVLVVIGNTESKTGWARAYGKLWHQYPNIVNGTWVRQIIADDVEFWTLPGYHDKAFIHQQSGCKINPEHIVELGALKPSGDRPVAIVAHGPPRGSAKTSLDVIHDGSNVGYDLLTQLIADKKVPFGLFGHILEAGGRAVALDMNTLVRANTDAAALYVNAGSISSTPWRLLNGQTSYGMAMVVTLQGGQARYETKGFDGNF